MEGQGQSGYGQGGYGGYGPSGMPPGVIPQTVGFETAPPPQEQKHGIKDFFTFRLMLTPLIIQIIFWLGVLGCIGAGIFCLIFSSQMGKNLQLDSIAVIGIGVATILLGPFVWRLYCEFMIVIFQIFKTLQEIREKLTPR